MLDTLAGSKWFTTLVAVVKSSYRKRIKKKQPFVHRKVCLNSMLCSLGYAPATFHRLMVASLQWSHCLVYLDDVIVLGQNLNFEDHLAKVKRSKCELLKRKVYFLGHIVQKKELPQIQ